MSEIREPTGIVEPVLSSIRQDAVADEQIFVSVRPAGAGKVIVEVGGEVDMLTSPQLRAVVLEQLAASGTDVVVLGLDKVTFLGTSGLAVLIELREATHAAGVELRIACTARRVLRPLTIAGLIPLFDIHDTFDKALEAT
ncbi:anti-sigma factor antagonist [Pseudonocardia sp. TRM90224]|uniref:anti-sigma factor antagonist n=1 Tax=Pseudonocardia sp. TRM90224 TaxID=2812678 RepID=UPI001E514FE3|nr:anti-sigma factor antagonist [Pseudonocardia sp. TRM90224]